MKKYLLILSTLELGGAERQAINFAKYLKLHKREVVILGLAHPGKVCEICENEGIPWIFLDSENKRMYRGLELVNIVTLSVVKKRIWAYGISLMYILAKYIKRNRFDVCISYCTYANTILGCSRKFYKKYIFVWFQRDSGVFDDIRGYQRKSIQQADFILANGNSGKEWLRKAYGVNARVIYNGVSLPLPKCTVDEWKNALKIKESDVVCSMLANLSGAKDHMSLLKAWKLLREQNRDEHLILVFAGRFDDQYRNLIAYVNENDMLEKIRFLGQIDDITGLLQVTSICVFGAISEGCPNGIIEPAMAGLPIVATNLPEVQEIVAKENYKYLFDKDDIITIADNVFELSRDAELRKRLGQKNKKKAEKIFSIEGNFEKIISVVENDCTFV